MKKLIRLLAIAALAYIGNPLCHAETFAINQFGGLNTDDSPITLQAQTPDAENVVTDDGPGIKGRNGFIAFSTEPASGLWEFPVSNGTRYLIEASTSSGKLKATTGDGVFSILIATIPTDRNIVATPLGDKFFFSDTANGLKYWNTSAVTTASSTLTFDKLVTFKGRLVGAGVAANQRVIYFSKLNDGTNFTLATNPSDDDPAQITVSGALDENITALYSSFQDKLVWFKNHSFGAIFGSRRSNFTQRTFSDITGTGTPESVRDCADHLRWLGPDRKIWEFDGSTYYKITEDIDTLMGTVAQGDSNSRNATQTSQADWQNGTQSPASFLDLTTAPGDATPATTTLIDTAQTDFQSGTCNSAAEACDTAVSSGSLSAKIFSSTITSQADWGAASYDSTVYVDTETSAGNAQTVYPETWDAFRNGTSGTKNVWSGATCFGTATSAITVTGGVLALHVNALSGGLASECDFRTTTPTHDLTAGGTIYFEVPSINVDAATISYFLALSTATSLPNGTAVFGDNIIYSWGRSGSSFQFTQIQGRKNGVINFSYAPFVALALPMSVKIIVTSAKWEVWHNGVLTASGTHTMNLHAYYAYLGVGVSAALGSDVGASVDNFSVSPQTFTVTTAGIDTGLTTNVLNWGNFTGTTSGSGTFAYQTRSSADNVTYDAAVSATSGSPITSNRKRYIKLLATPTYAPSSLPGTPAAVTDLSVVAYDTMSFTSRAFNSALTPPVWGLFTVSTAAVGGGGATSWQSQSSDDGLSWTTAVPVTPATQPASAMKRYWRYVASSTPAANGGYDRIDAVSLAVKSTGTFTTQTVDFGPSISAYGPIVINDTQVLASSITYQFSSASTSGGVGGSWTTIAKGATPTGTVNRFAAIRAIYWMTVATQAPTLSDITYSWNEGSTIKTASSFFNNRYWLSVAISSTSNNRVLLYDKKKNWQRYSAINADAMALYNSKLYFSNSTGIFQAESGYSDNGVSITSYYRTPSYAANKLDLYSNFDYLYMTTDPSDSTLATTYQVQGIATDYSLGSVQMNASTGLQNFKLPFGQSEVQTGKFINFKWQVSGTSFWRINNGSLYFQPAALPE